jgi:aquaporin NIP
MTSMHRKWIAEFIGTYFLVFAGTGAIVIDELRNSITHIGVSLTFGMVVTALIYAFGHISGAHLNPAVTAGFLVNRDIPLREACHYMVAQMLGATAASVTLRLLFGNVAHLGATLPRDSWQQSFVLEWILTFALMMVIFGSAVHGKAIKSFAGIAIGVTVGLEAMFAGPISGASMNPARSLAPAIVSGTWKHVWIYAVATTLGAITAAWVYRMIHEGGNENEK